MVFISSEPRRARSFAILISLWTSAATSGSARLTGIAGVRHQVVIRDPAMANFPLAGDLYEIVLIGALSHDLVARGRSDRNDRGRAPVGPVALHIIEMVERHRWVHAPAVCTICSMLQQ